MSETAYAINLRYVVDSRGGRQGTQALNSDVKELAKSTKLADGAFMALGQRAVELGTRAFEVMKHSLIGFNAEVENANIGLSAMIQGNIGGTWDAAAASADKLYYRFQKFSTQTPVTTSEILQFGKAVAVSTFQAGGSIEDLTIVAEKGVIAAKAFGYATAYTSLELSEMLAGNVNNRMMFAKQLLGMAHTSAEEFKKLNADKRLALVKQTLDSDAMKNAQEAFSKSWTGVTSTLEDKIQIALGSVGLPLFRAITSEVAKWNTWLDKNSVTVEHIAKQLGEGLVQGFGMVKDAISFLVEHRESIMAMGKVWLAVKVGTLLGGGASGALGGPSRLSALGAWGAKGRDEFDPATGGYKYTGPGAGMSKVTTGNIIGNLPLVAQSAAVGYALGTLINDATGLSHKFANMGIDSTTKAFESLERSSNSLTDAMDRAAAANPDRARVITNLEGGRSNASQMANLAADAARAQAQMVGGDVGAMRKYTDSRAMLESLGVSGEDISKAGGLQAFADQMNAKADQLGQRQYELGIKGLLAYEIGTRQLTEYQKQTLDTAKAQQDVLAYINSHGLSIDPKAIMEILRGDTADPYGKHKPMADKPTVNVHIARIEVQSDDPDRMAFGLIESFRDAAKNPSSAFATLREG